MSVSVCACTCEREHLCMYVCLFVFVQAPLEWRQRDVVHNAIVWAREENAKKNGIYINDECSS